MNSLPPIVNIIGFAAELISSAGVVSITSVIALEDVSFVNLPVPTIIVSQHDLFTIPSKTVLGTLGDKVEPSWDK